MTNSLSKVTWLRYRKIILAIILSNIVSVGFLVAKVISTNSWGYSFLLWNLTLAWLPLLFATLLFISLTKQRWLSWQNLALSFLWLVFLPNSFYLASDLIHLRTSSQSTVLFDVVMLLSFSFNGFLTGMMSLYMVHKELYKRFWASQAHGVIAAVLMSSSFAIYLGRNLRWNTWDVFINPAGLLFDVSDRFIDPIAHPQALTTTLGFFVLLGSIYVLIWQFVQALKRD